MKKDVDPTGEAVVASTREAAGSSCAGCECPLCGHDVVLSLVLGYRNRPRCHRCLAEVLGEDPGHLVARVGQYLRRRDCYRAGWTWASRDEGFDPDAAGPPPCIHRTLDEPVVLADLPGGATRDPQPDEPAASVWDAGEMGCGDLVLELRLRLRALRPGEVLRVTAHDPGAPKDIPSWCNLTGNPLRACNHPDYWIQRKLEPPDQQHPQP